MASKVSDFGYSFVSAKREDGSGLYLEISPCSDRGILPSRMYWFTRDEVKALIACLDILD